MTLTGPTNSPSRRFASTVSMVVPSKSTYGWPRAALRLTSGARFVAEADCVAAACDGKLVEERAVSAELSLFDGTAASTESVCAGDERVAPTSAATMRFDAKRALKANSRSASAMGSRWGSVAGGDGIAGGGN